MALNALDIVVLHVYSTLLTHENGRCLLYDI